MEERLKRIEAALVALEQSFQALEVRVGSLEQRAVLGEEPSLPSAPTSLSTASVAPVPPAALNVIALTGMGFLALAGAYLLRALTESGTLAPRIGILVGLAYAFGWFTMAARRRGADIAATFHGGIACAIAFPLVWEASTKFRLLDASAASLAAGAVAAAALLVAARRRLQALAWIGATATIGLALALMIATDRVLPFALLTIALGIVTLWLGYVREWLLLRWPVAFVADVLVAGAAFRVVAGNDAESAALVAIVALLLPTAYLIAIIVRTLVRGRDVIPFEVTQAVCALGVGLGALIAVARHVTYGSDFVAWGALALGGACYGVAILFLARRQGSKANLVFYTSIGLILVIVSVALMASDSAIVFGGIAVATAVMAAKSPLWLPAVHTAVYTAAATVTSNLISIAAPRFFGATIDGTPLTRAAALAALAAAASFVLTGREDRTQLGRIARFVILLPGVLGAGAWVVSALAETPRSGTAGFDAGVVATIRSVVIAATVILAAAFARLDRGREAGWLVYPLLALGGVKLIVDDIPHSLPATLFVALAAYGIALIVAPRLRSGWSAVGT